MMALLRLMKRAGCALTMIGNESGCTGMLDRLRKDFTRADVERCFSVCESEGIRYNAFLLVGGPGEDRASVEESVELMERFRPSQVSISVGIRLYPGCELTRIAEAEGVLRPGESFLTPKFYLSSKVRDWIWEYLASMMQRHPNWAY